MKRFIRDMLFGLLGFGLAIFFTWCWAAQAQAAPLCRPHDQIVKILADKFDERLHGIGLTFGKQLPLELYVSDAGSWTVLVTAPNNVACVWAFGEQWSDVETASPAGGV